MKTIFIFLLLSVANLCFAQDDDFCICMLDQPAYNAALDDTFANTGEFTNLLFPQSSTTAEPSFVLLQQEIIIISKKNRLEIG